MDGCTQKGGTVKDVMATPNQMVRIRGNYEYMKIIFEPLCMTVVSPELFVQRITFV